MRIISWDVGIKNLAYCILEDKVNEKNERKIDILKWGLINLVGNDYVELECCGHNKNDKKCCKKASYCMDFEGKQIGFCKTHLKQSSDYWSEDKMEHVFQKCSEPHDCQYVKRNKEQCMKKTAYCFKSENPEYYCTAHYNTMYKLKVKSFSANKIKNKSVGAMQTYTLQLNMINILDTLCPLFAKHKIEEVVIENQPAFKNPKMKSIANTLNDFFIIRGVVDKSHGLDIKHIKLMCPSNKLKVNSDNTLSVLSKSKEKYKLTKELGIIYTRQLVKGTKFDGFIDEYKKKDDLCDSFLQGRYYLEFMRNKDWPPVCPSKTKHKEEHRRVIHKISHEKN
jgi:hypothetical protein